jgi:hypothetical protein
MHTRGYGAKPQQNGSFPAKKIIANPKQDEIMMVENQEMA